MKTSNMNKQITDFNKIQFINGGKGLDTVTLKVRHFQSDYNDELIINANCWCDIGGHKVPEWMLHNTMADASVCEDCWEHFN
jgi:hypothetical protein